MKVRGITKEDIDSIINIINRNYDEVMIRTHSKDVLQRFRKHNTFEDWESQMKWKEIFVVENDNEVIATGALANFGDSACPKYTISNFFVEPNNQNQGLGKLLFQHILQIIKDRKIEFLHVPSSRTGFEFYKKMGFTKDDIQDDKVDEITWMTMKL